MTMMMKQWYTRATATMALVTLQFHRPSFSRLSQQRLTMTSNTTNYGDDLNAIFNHKRMLRTQVKKVLKAIEPSLRSQQDHDIQNIILGAPWFKSSLRLCAYISCSALREVDTSKLLSEILKGPASGGKKLYVPRVEDKNSHMRMLNISPIDDLVVNSMDILEPAPVDSDGNAPEDGLAFDRSGRRLGRGGGYYDTFLENYQDLAKTRNWKQPLLVALSYSEQILEEGVIPITPSDVPIDALVSPEGVIPISTAAFNRVSQVLASSSIASVLQPHNSSSIDSRPSSPVDAVYPFIPS
ncbi:PREDICTED: 5-formyltetrahydrofolate cyclo-ligase, mitochondrial-like isoform X2 [Lupinus angustifolius]|uniref:5-formyltetrahydrofolate cyclo-ligase, mitochondrial-like isoform X2 n=1 Tax=Lupinus angustifolius TaxID=3871 RepID=UPI00092F6166|nr:PREDICTED: 5-formyltetrahydrofolate cyclo-ligase, mitochondrial-like isoform X2 [Lupinus angustifolius]